MTYGLRLTIIVPVDTPAKITIALAGIDILRQK